MSMQQGANGPSNGPSRVYAYITSKSYPSSTADHIYVRELVRALSKYSQTYLVVGGMGKGATEELSGIQVVNSGLNWRRLRSLGYFAWVPMLASRVAPDVIISNDQWIFLSLIFWKRLGLIRSKLVFDLHARSNTYKENLVLRYTDALMTVTSCIQRRVVLQFPGLKGRVFTFPNAVNLDVFDINESQESSRTKLGLDVNAKLVVYTGRFKTLGMEKGIGDIIQAFRSQDLVGVNFVGVGARPEELREYEKYMEAAGVSNVVLIGEVSQPELALYQKASDALIMYFPDKLHYREFMSPMKMFEYMATGVPIISSDLPVLREVLKHEVNSLLVAPSDYSQWATALDRLVSNREFAFALGNTAHTDYLTNHTWLKRAEALLKLARHEK